MFRGLERRVENSYAARSVQAFLDLEGMDRGLVLASQSFTALIPLLLVLSAVAPGKDSINDVIVNRLHLTGDAANAVNDLFARPADSAGSLSILSVLLLLYAGVSLTRRLQRLYLNAYGLPRLGARGPLNAALGLAALLVEIALLSSVRTLVRGLPFDWGIQLPLSLLSGLLLWTSIPWLLLDRRLHWRRLLPGGALASVAMSLYGIGTTIYMPALIERDSRRYGLFGVTIAMVSWLLCICLVLVMTAAAGAEFDRTRDPWANRVRAFLRIEMPAEAAPARPPVVDEELDNVAVRRGEAMRTLLVNWGIVSVAVAVAAAVVPSITITGGLWTLLWVALLVGLVNAILGPLLHLLAMPLTVLTFGLFALVVNGLLLAITAGLSSKLAISSFWGAVLGALIISVVSAVLQVVVSPRSRQPR